MTATNFKPKKRKQDGDIICKIYFVEHRLSQAFSMRSTKSQDRKGTSIQRFKDIVLGKKEVNGQNWRGKVNWCGIFHAPTGKMLEVYRNGWTDFQYPEP